ncbi:MAG TPA: protein-glutamate O-methyltransferase CheR [Bryobacteraceae bacterium]|nr:protein-glutamate O-methyltransferase CheR [Bryobacteraceae bacterium]
MLAQTELAPLTKSEFRQFQELILAEAGITLNESKHVLVQSRMARRLRALGLSSYGEYLVHLAGQPPESAERREMINCITTNKTDFFRENHHFQFLRNRVIPELRAAAAKGSEKKIRIWSAACSTGEEPYSIAITIREALGAERNWDVKILASDVDTNVLSTAEAGIYDAERFQQVEDSMLRRYFTRRKTDGALLVNAGLKQMIRFRRINFVDPAWPIRVSFDVIFCRNVIIYFNRTTQQKLFERLGQYLKPTGYLLVGHSENLHWMHHLLVPAGQAIYRLRSPE